MVSLVLVECQVCIGEEEGTETWPRKVMPVCSELLGHVELSVGEHEIGSHLRQEACPVLVSPVTLNNLYCYDI